MGNISIDVTALDGNGRVIDLAAGEFQVEMLAADRANLAKWSKAYIATKGPMQPLVGALVNHVQSLK